MFKKLTNFAIYGPTTLRVRLNTQNKCKIGFQPTATLLSGEGIKIATYGRQRGEEGLKLTLNC